MYNNLHKKISLSYELDYLNKKINMYSPQYKHIKTLSVILVLGHNS